MSPMTDRDEIANTLSRFMNSFDLKDWESMLALLEPTLRLDYSDLRGSAPTELSASEYVKLRAEALQHLATQHLLANLDVATSDDSATVTASCLIQRSDGTRQLRLARPLHVRAVAEQRLVANLCDPAAHPVERRRSDPAQGRRCQAQLKRSRSPTCARANHEQPRAAEQRARAEHRDRDAGRLREDAERDAERDLAEVLGLREERLHASRARRSWCAG